MGRYMTDEMESRSDLQQRIAAELREKASKTSKNEGEEVKLKEVDGIEDQDYLRGYKKTTTLAPVWVGIIIGCIAVFIYFVYKVNN